MADKNFAESGPNREPDIDYSDTDLRAGALRGEPAQLAAYARRLELVPKLLAAWNRRIEEPLDQDELAELASSASIELWQDLPQFTGVEPLDMWLARSAAQHLRLDTDEDAAFILDEARSIEDAPGQAGARDALARFRAEQKLRPATGPNPQRPIWAVIGVLGVIATFLAVSPYSPLRGDPAPAITGPAGSTPPPVAQAQEFVPLAPLEPVQLVKEFRWSAPPGLRCTLIVETLRGTPLVRASGIVSGTYAIEQALPSGRLRWKLLPDDPKKGIPPTDWIEFDHSH